jgi:hypothetical protein
LLIFHFTLVCNYEGRKRKRRKSSSWEHFKNAKWINRRRVQTLLDLMARNCHLQVCNFQRNSCNHKAISLHQISISICLHERSQRTRWSSFRSMNGRFCVLSRWLWMSTLP